MRRVLPPCPDRAGRTAGRRGPAWGILSISPGLALPVMSEKI